MPPETSLTKTRSVIATTCIVLILALALGTLGAHVIAAMKVSANALDDRRAILAAESGLTGLKQHLAGIVRDNAVWDEAYDAVSGSDAEAWIYKNWGRTSADYPLYDAAVVSGTDGHVVAGFWKAQPFDAKARLGSAFLEEMGRIRPGAEPVVNIFATDQGIVLVGSQAIEPFSRHPTGKVGDVLSLVKVISAQVIDRMSDEHQLDGLSLRMKKVPGLLQVPLEDPDGRTIGWLAWPSEAPGTRIYQQVHPYILAGIALLGAFIITVVAAGGAEARHLLQLADRFHHQATHDSLTGLYNRFGIVEELTKQLQPHRKTDFPMTMHLLDLDGFKPVNDAWGHAIGDQLLRLTADALRRAHPEVYAAARIGGDEFALLQIGSSSPDDFARAILDVFSAPFIIDGRTIEIGGSIGIASAASVTDSQELLRRADMALYRAKETGRGRSFTFADGLEAERVTAATLESDLRLALQHGEIEVAFQPLVSCHTGATLGVEALARWNKATGPIAPDIFIAVAERSGLIDCLGLQILRKALYESKSWPLLAVSVNVSPVQLCNPNFAADVLAVLADEAFDPERLTLEITEGVLMSNPEQAKRAIDLLRSEGIHFALDDFGCGYASIGALREFGFDRMKIDRSLVLGADLERRGLEVLKATISLATALNIPVTAEGIESNHQAEMLRDAGCDQLQGYLLGKPMPAESLRALLQQQAA